ncbi:MAG: hypothetical protein SGPRY_005929 [Prymnesium sp.]
MEATPSLLPLVVAGAIALIWLAVRRRQRGSRLAKPPSPGEEHPSLRSTKDALATSIRCEPTSLSAGTRVQFHGLVKAAELNGTYGVVIRFDKSISRFEVRKEVALPGESCEVIAKTSNLQRAQPHADLQAVQRVVDTAPAGARVTLHRGKVEAHAAEQEQSSVDVLTINSAITLAGMGSRSGGTVLGFGICIGPEVAGELVGLCGIHINGAVEVSPRQVSQLKLTKVAITAPADAPALIIDEISSRVPPETECLQRVLLDECWVRGGKVGVEINAVGCTLRRCRIQEASTFGIHANANFSIEGCTIGDCGKSGRGGGILSRAVLAIFQTVGVALANAHALQ